MDRRRFISSAVPALGGALLLRPRFTRAEGREAAANVPATADAAAGAPFPDIVLARGEAREATHRAIDALGGMTRFVSPGQVVALKPNASFEAPPDWGATTHPEVLAAVIEACFAAEARRVLVLDHTMRGGERCFRRNGTTEAVAEFPPAKLVALEEERMYREIEIPDGEALRQTAVPVALTRADVFINVPTAKSHAATGVSLGLKNLMGLVWDRHTFHQDIDLHVGIADLATVLRPQLTILDAVRILKTGGPAGPGTVDPFNGVVAGVDPVAVDSYGVGLSSWNGQTYQPWQVAYISHAARRGLGTHDLDSLRVEELG